MSENSKYEIPQIPGVGVDMIPPEHKKQVLKEVGRLVHEKGDHRCEIARLFDASSEEIQKLIRNALKGTRYECY